MLCLDIATCESGWKMFGNNCYQVSTDRNSFDGAEASCRSNGGHLTSIHSQEELNFIKDITSSKLH